MLTAENSNGLVRGNMASCPFTRSDLPEFATTIMHFAGAENRFPPRQTTTAPECAENGPKTGQSARFSGILREAAPARHRDLHRLVRLVAILRVDRAPTRNQQPRAHLPVAHRQPHQ